MLSSNRAGGNGFSRRQWWFPLLLPVSSVLLFPAKWPAFSRNCFSLCRKHPGRPHDALPCDYCGLCCKFSCFPSLFLTQTDRVCVLRRAHPGAFFHHSAAARRARHCHENPHKKKRLRWFCNYEPITNVANFKGNNCYRLISLFYQFCESSAYHQTFTTHRFPT